MEKFNAQAVIEILKVLASNFQLDSEQIDEAIEDLERIKSTIPIENDEAIDKVDEIQDYLQYLLTADDDEAEIKEELSAIISELREGL